MLIFSLTLFYTGLHQVLWGGVYTTSIGYTQALGEDRKKIAALCGIIFGAGEVLGGILFGFLGNVTVKRGRDPVILLGFVVSVLSYFLIFINLPSSAPLCPTYDLGRKESSQSRPDLSINLSCRIFRQAQHIHCLGHWFSHGIL